MAALTRLEQLVIARRWVGRFGLGFHPDTRGKDYRPALSATEVAEYSADMNRLFSGTGDPYGAGITAMKEHEQTAKLKAMTAVELNGWYEGEVGYRPQVDDPSMSNEYLLELCIGALTAKSDGQAEYEEEQAA